MDRGDMQHYVHGWQPCRACHEGTTEVRVDGPWHLRANPGYWGSSAPEVLVLGFSKGATQIAAAAGSNFDSVAFAGMRDRLAKVLAALDVDLGDADIDTSLRADGGVLGAASLVRCGLSLMKDGKLTTSGTIMPSAMASETTRGYMARCIERHIDPLPESVRLVVLLGTTDAYVKGVRALMQARFSDFQDINEVAFLAQGRRWVFAAHPSPANGTFNDWLQGDASSAARKRQFARDALALTNQPGASAPPSSRAVTTPPPPTPSRPTTNSDVRATTFYLLTDDGKRQIPIRMKNRDTGRVAFRLSKLGNTKADSIEVNDEAEALRLCESGQYMIRVVTDGAAQSNELVRPLLGRRIVRR